MEDPKIIKTLCTFTQLNRVLIHSFKKINLTSHTLDLTRLKTMSLLKLHKEIKKENLQGVNQTMDHYPNKLTPFKPFSKNFLKILTGQIKSGVFNLMWEYLHR